MRAHNFENRKLIVFTDTLNTGGKERQLVEMIFQLADRKYFQKKNISVLTMSTKGYFDDVLEKKGIKVIRILRKWRWDPSVVWQIRKIIKTAEPTILHSFSEMPSFYLSFLKKSKNRIFVDASIRDAIPIQGIIGTLVRIIINLRADAVIANSAAGMRAQKAPNGKCHVLYNGFNFERIKNTYSINEIKGSLGIVEKHTVGMVANFHPRKDYETFIATAEEVIKFNKNVAFIAIGDGETLKYIKNLVSVKSKSKIVFLGHREDVESIIKIFSIGVLFSNNCLHREGISNSIMEYMASGKPVIANHSGGTSEIVEDGVNGYLIRQGGVKQVADKIIQLLDDDELRNELGNNGKATIANKFEINIMARKLIKIYDHYLK